MMHHVVTQCATLASDEVNHSAKKGAGMRYRTASRISPEARRDWRIVDPSADDATVDWAIRGPFLFGSRVVMVAANGEAVLSSWRYPGVYVVISDQRVVTRVLTAPGRRCNASPPRSKPADSAAPASARGARGRAELRVFDGGLSHRPPVRVSQVAGRSGAAWQRQLDRTAPRRGTCRCQQRRGKR